MVNRVYVEKRPPYAVEAAALLAELRALPGCAGLSGVRLLNRYDVEGISPALWGETLNTVFSEPPVDALHTAPPAAAHTIAVEYLPGQFDQRADSAAECVQLISQAQRPTVRSAKLYLLESRLSEDALNRIKGHLINPVEAREAGLELPDTLLVNYPAPPDIPVLSGFCAMDEAGRLAMIESYGLAMDEADLAFCQRYFQSEGREPTLTELRMIDTYWSDHCRHTTFGTVLDDVTLEDAEAKNSWALYQELRGELGREGKPVTLMDMATIGAKALKTRGLLPQLDESEEINACSVHMEADNGGTPEPWLLLFKNETHNHPTEIEPFGGAATCIGGAIRDPLANRGYVFGAMRVTGAGDPRTPLGDTLPGKLPQQKLCQTAAAGYSSYGNQIGLATGQVTELYHPGYVAKRMEVGAVLGAVPLANVRREVPKAGDVVLLLGGRTGRDGCGGATGSSKAHGAGSLAACGAEVQKGNAPVERKLQRLFKNPAASRLIRRCNDFGAGGVSVAIGELADGLCVDLDAVPKKYEGLDGTELAISESQERMAVVVAENDAEPFIRLAAEENLEATRVAVVAAEPRLIMRWRGREIANLSREFLSSNGAEKHAAARVPALPALRFTAPEGESLSRRLAAWMADLRFCCQKGLAERFDSTIGAATVLLPFGGRHQMTPAQCLAMKLPVAGETETCAGMAFGFDPCLNEQNPHTGAYLAVVESVAKLVASGFRRKDTALSFQEYFERLGTEPLRWGKPVAALLGALRAQIDLGVAAIGGKDSMSGSFETLDVPPTLISFAVAPGKVDAVLSPEFKLPGSRVVWLRPNNTAPGAVNSACAAPLAETLDTVETLAANGSLLAAWAVGSGGVAEALFKMCAGNRVGVCLVDGFDKNRLFEPAIGSFVLELEDTADVAKVGETLGETTAKYSLAAAGETVDLAEVEAAWRGTLANVYPFEEKPCGEQADENINLPLANCAKGQRAAPKMGVAKPRALVPVFPGTNCEYDTARALFRAGAEADVFVVRNLTPADVAASAAEMAKSLAACQMLVLPGGFSGGDEPEGSAKLIAAFLRGAVVADALTSLLEHRDGLVLGICNGFQALIKLGLLPHGRITTPDNNAPTLTFNRIGRHQSMLVRTRVASNLSPWLSLEETGAVHTVAVSHGEGRFVAPPDVLRALAQNGQIATQYVDLAGQPTLRLPHNPNGSTLAVEGITSPDGRVLGKMGHTERSGDGLYRNVPMGDTQRLFAGGVEYFRV